LINYAHRKKNFRQVFQKYSSDKMLEVANIPVIMRREAYEQQQKGQTYVTSKFC